jgi:ABC-type lipoprotein export system ATPase subunit
LGDLPSILQQVRGVELELTRKVAQRDTFLEQKKSFQNTLRSTQEQIKIDIQVQRLLEVFVKSTEVSVRNYLEPLVTEALDFVFNQGLQFHLLFVTRRNQVEIDFILLRDSESEEHYQKYVLQPEKFAKQLEVLVKETKQLNFMYGGAVNQVIALVLRLVLSELLRIQGPIFLDEPSSAVGEEYSARLGQLLASLSERFKRQYVLVTHSHSLASYAEKIYEVEKVNGVSQVNIKE